MTELKDQWLTIEEASTYLDIGKTKLYEFIKDKKIPARKVAGQWKFNKREIDSWMKSKMPIEDFFMSFEANIDGNILLREPQREGYSATYEYLKSGKNNPILQIPVGCGKSGLISLLPFGIARGRVLVIAPNLEIKKGIYEALDITNKQKCFWLKADVLPESSLYGGPYVTTLDNVNMSVINESHLVVTNIQQLAIDYDKWLSKFPNDYFDVIIVDEGHHSTAKSWQNVFNHFPQAKVIHLTATPFRSDGQRLNGEIAYKYSFKSATRKGYIKNIRTSYVAPSDIEIEFVANDEKGHYTLEEVLTMKEDEWFSKEIALSQVCNVSIVDNSLAKLEDLRLTGTKHQLIAVACTISHAKSIASLYRERGYSAEVVHSKMKRDKIDKVLLDLKNGSLDCIIQVQMLGEGFDHPKLSVAAIFRPFRTLNPYLQFVGRIMRVVVQNNPEHPDNQGFVISHIGMNLDKLVDNFKDFENDDLNFWEEVTKGEIEEEVPDDVKEGRAKRRIKPKMIVHNELVESLVESSLTMSSDENDIKSELKANLEALGLNPELADEIINKQKSNLENSQTLAKASQFQILPQNAHREARKRLSEEVQSKASVLINNSGLERHGQELRQYIGGIPGQNNYIISLKLIWSRIKALQPDLEYDEWTTANFNDAQNKLPEIITNLTRQIIAGKNAKEK